MSVPIVVELQRLASESECPVDQLLRKALLVATKLDVQDFRDWIQLELNGYPNSSKVPPYRIAVADIRLVNPVLGRLIPFYLPPDIAEPLEKAPIRQAIGTLVELSGKPSDTFQMTIPPELRQILLEGQGRLPMEPVMQISRVYITTVLDAVRNMILEWSLRLEQRGILGEGMRFSSEEKAIAMSSSNIHIGSFQGVLGNINNSEVSLHQHMEVKAGDFASLSATLAQSGVEDGDIHALKEAVDSDLKTVAAEKLGPRVSSWIGGMMTKAASGAWKVTLETAGKLLPTAIAAYYGLKG
jgi:hypothetical protein